MRTSICRSHHGIYCTHNYRTNPLAVSIANVNFIRVTMLNTYEYQGSSNTHPTLSPICDPTPTTHPGASPSRSKPSGSLTVEPPTVESTISPSQSPLTNEPSNLAPTTHPSRFPTVFPPGFPTGVPNDVGTLNAVTGNYHQPNQILLNNGNGNFPSVQDLPGWWD